MPYTKEERKEYNRLWRIKNRDKMYKQQKEWAEKNKEKLKQRKKEWYEKNKEKMKLIPKSDIKLKQSRIYNWIRQGILCFDWDLLYDLFLSTTNCEFCNVELTIDQYATSTRKELDHNHHEKVLFNVNGVLCHSCNIKDVLNIQNQFLLL